MVAECGEIVRKIVWNIALEKLWNISKLSQMKKNNLKCKMKGNKKLSNCTLFKNNSILSATAFRVNFRQCFVNVLKKKSINFPKSAPFVSHFFLNGESILLRFIVTPEWISKCKSWGDLRAQSTEKKGRTAS